MYTCTVMIWDNLLISTICMDLARDQCPITSVDNTHPRRHLCCSRLLSIHSDLCLVCWSRPVDDCTKLILTCNWLRDYEQYTEMIWPITNLSGFALLNVIKTEYSVLYSIACWTNYRQLQQTPTHYLTALTGNHMTTNLVKVMWHIRLHTAAGILDITT